MRFHVETKDANYVIEAQYMLVNGSLSFMGKPRGGGELMTVIAFGAGEWLMAGLCDSEAILSIEAKPQSGADHAQ